MARPKKITTEVLAVVLKHVADGVPYKHAARLAGTSYSAFRREVRADPALREIVRTADSLAVSRHVARIKAAGYESWQASAWWLERRHPDEFGSDRRRVRELERALADLTRLVAELRQRDADRDRAAGVHNRLNGVLN